MNGVHGAVTSGRDGAERRSSDLFGSRADDTSMVDASVLLGGLFVVLGIVILIPAFLIAFRGRADLHVHYDDDVDPAYVSRRAGSTALLMGILVTAYGLHQMVYGFYPTAFWGLMGALLVLSQLTKRFAQGWGAS